jgi:hypothetical protein
MLTKKRRIANGRQDSPWGRVRPPMEVTARLSRPRNPDLLGREKRWICLLPVLFPYASGATVDGKVQDNGRPFNAAGGDRAADDMCDRGCIACPAKQAKIN